MPVSIEKVFELALKDGGKTLEYKLADEDGNEVGGKVELDIYLENCDGEFKWGGKSFSLSAEDISFDSETFKLSASLRTRKGAMVPASINLAERFYNVNGHLTYLQFGEAPSAGPLGGLELEGDIDGRTFAVASDGPNKICRIAYKTVLNNKISLAEVKYDGTRKSWSLPKEIDLYKKKPTPGQNIAFAVDPVDSNKRHLFFCQETGSGELYYQTFDPEKKKWAEPQRMGQYKAHRFSKFAATYYNVGDVKLLLFYYISESNDLQEVIGVLTEDEDAPGTYKYRWTASILAPDIPSNTFLAASQRKNETVLTCRATNPKTKKLDLVLFRGCKREENDETHTAKWDKRVGLVSEDQILRNSPLAIVHRHHGQLLTFFYVQRNGRDKIIYSQDYLKGKDFPPRNVGKLESESILGAASFQENPVHDARLFSVSNLDGDDILVERVPKFIGDQRLWVIAGGIIDTDVDELTHVARSTTVA